MSIAKLFEIDGKQVVVLKTNEPAVELQFEMEDLTASLTLNFPDTDDGFDNRDRAFDTLDEEALAGIRESMLEDLEDDSE